MDKVKTALAKLYKSKEVIPLLGQDGTPSFALVDEAIGILESLEVTEIGVLHAK